jgi:hypothetical protein
MQALLAIVLFMNTSMGFEQQNREILGRKKGPGTPGNARA